MGKTAQDLRYGLRTLGRAPGFAVISILVMALGVGATTSLFTIVRAVLLKALPFEDPDKLVMVYEHSRKSDAPYSMVAPGDFRDWREQTHGFQDMAAWRWWGCNLTGEHTELPEVVAAAAGSWNLFSLLGVQPALGRRFVYEEDQPGANKVVMLSWSLFQRRFNGNPEIVGKQVRLDTNSYTVIGVLPQWFTYPQPVVQLWVPYIDSFEPPGGIFQHDDHQSFVIARVKTDVSAAAAIKQVSALQYQIHMANQSLPIAEDAVFRPMIDDVVQDAKTPLLVLLGSVVCMLLIACLNLSNLLVARGAARRKEVAIRAALGGDRFTLLREQMTESFLICLIGGTLGVILSFSATQWLAGHWQRLPRADSIHMDGLVLAFAIILVFLCTMLAGLVPAISSTGTSVLTVLQDSSRSVGGSVSRANLRRILLAVEIALTVILTVSSGLLFKSFIHLRTSDLGCVTENVLTMKYGLPEKQYDKPEMVLAFHESLLERVRRLPGVQAAGLVSTAPGDGYEGDLVFTIPEHPSQAPSENSALYRSADPGYFKALQIPLQSGRFFKDDDRLERTHYVIISRKFADQVFSNESPLGKHVSLSWTNKTEPYEIIGVVGDTLHDLGQPVKATVYFPIFSGIPDRTSGAAIVIHTAGEPLALSVPVQRQVAALDPSLPVYDVFTMQQIIERATASQSFSATLVLSFAALSLLLAAIGLYGVLSYLVSQRVTEIGIRLALGAQRGEVLRLVLLDGLRPVLIGLLIGSGGAIAAGLLIRSVLYQTQPVDPVVFATTVGILLLSAIVAGVVPGLRVCRIEPTQALRAE